ncbi:MAG: TonB-dependent receptor domain-containing protein [Parcubacteria group bacterium]
MTSEFRKFLLAGSATALLVCASPAAAQVAKPVTFDIPSQPLGAALAEFARQSNVDVLFSSQLARNQQSPALQGEMPAPQALAMLLSGTGLSYRASSGGSFVIEASPDPQGGSAAGGGAEVEALIVTAQKKEEAIQDVPIAISAFTQKSLEEQKIEGGFDLLKAIPNVTFSKNNFTSYNFSIRGIGTKAVSATTDPGVAVSFNNIALIQNRLFEQEYFDVERVEVLRGPQGTLYGRNATAGVINVISAKPSLTEFKGWVKGEVGNYHSKRISAMVNVPLVEDKLAIRFAGAMTDRQGYDYNSVTKNHVNGRDLWSARVTVGFNPTENFRANLLWERFNEDDNRSRTGKQLCHRDPGIETINGHSLLGPDPSFAEWESIMRPALFSQGCKPGSLYDEAAFGTPNGLALPFVFGMLALGSYCGVGCNAPLTIGFGPDNHATSLMALKDPYGGQMQSRDLRTIASFRDPIYQAQADLIELNAEIDLNDKLVLTSQTAYNKDTIYSFQDYNRFNTVPVFTDTSQLSRSPKTPFNPTGGGLSLWSQMAPGGRFCDPQLGCSNTLAGFDISRAAAKQFTQELRLQSDVDGKLHFSAGANYTTFDVLVDYYVMYNVITAFAMMRPFNLGKPTSFDITKCAFGYIDPVLGYVPGEVDSSTPGARCPYIDPNPLERMDGEGHNYFRSKNPYKLQSGAVFGEIYWNLSDALKLTAGLRYTNDRKTFTPVPTQVLLGIGSFQGGTTNKGYPEREPIRQQWGEWTGRLGLDWKPDLSFTDQTLLYAFYSRGYKGGGANPPTPGFANAAQYEEVLRSYKSFDEDTIQFLLAVGPTLRLTAVEYGPTFNPEFVNAFEVGAKNTLLDGAMTLNGGAFFYDYRDYQVSQIRDRSAVNENFDAKVWGLELESVFSPSRSLRLIGNIGYLDTRIADGETSIDIMNRTQGDPNYVLVKPWVQMPSNCIVPTAVVESWLSTHGAGAGYGTMCGGAVDLFLTPPPIDPNPDIGGGVLPYDPLNYPEIHGGAGIRDQLGGNELPNSPHWTVNLGAQYGFDFAKGWRATIRSDAYWQSQSWARVYNAVNDKLHGWYNANLSLWIENDEGLKVELYAKNILDKTPITDAFINSDDTALTTNVFVLDPRLIGLSIRKEF